MTAATRQSQVLVGDAKWQPTEQGKAVVRFDKSPLVWNGKVRAPGIPQYTGYLRKMVKLGRCIAHVFDDMIGYHDVERFGLERKFGPLDLDELVPLGNYAAVCYVNRMHCEAGLSQSS